MGLMEKWQNRSSKGVEAQGPAPLKRKIHPFLGWPLRIFWVLLVAYVVFNQFDARLEPRRFTRADLPQAEDRPDNGYWLLWALDEPVGVNIRSEEVLKRSKARYREEKKDWGRLAGRLKDHKKQPFQEAIKKLPPKMGYYEGGVRLSDLIRQQPEVIENLDPVLQVLVDRIDQLIQAPYIQEWTEENGRTPYPGSTVFNSGVRLRSALAVHQGLKGDWIQAFEKLKAQLDLGRRMMRGSQTFSLIYYGRSVMKQSLLAMADLLNQPECPREFCQAVLGDLPELQYEEFGARKALINEYLEWEHFFIRPKGRIFRTDSAAFRFLLSLFYHKNRTLNEEFRGWRNAVRHDETPPHRWAAEGVEALDTVIKPFWWLQNPVGKGMQRASSDELNTWALSIASDSWQLPSLTDMVRLSAWLHLRYDGTRTVPELMASPDCPALIDPCSGGPYRWNEKKQVLYSLDVDQKDNGGETRPYYYSEGDCDFPLPVVLFVK